MTQNKKLIAITGGIGSGKSEVAKIIKDLGYAVYSCDEIYAELLNSGVFYKEFTAEFGNIFNSDGLNRKKFSEKVFSNDENLKKLNRITHPKIFEELFKRMAKEEGVCFAEVPLLFESQAENNFNDVIIVLRDINQRVSSVALRDNLTEMQISKRIEKQFDYSSADLNKYNVIINDGNLFELKQKVISLIQNLDTRKN